MAQEPLKPEWAESEGAWSAYPQNLLQVAWRRKALLLLGLLVGLGGGVIYYAQQPPVYQSSTQVMVVKKEGKSVPTSIGPDLREFYYGDMDAFHQNIIKSQVVIQAAVKTHQLDQLPTFAGRGNPTGIIRGSLGVAPGSNPNQSTPGTSFLILSFQGPVAEDCPKVLQAVMASYQAFLDQNYKTVSDEALAQVAKATEELQKNLDDKEKAYKEFQKQAPSEFWKTSESNPREDWLVQVQARRIALALSQAETQERLARIEAAVKDGQTETALALLNAAEARDRNPGLLDEKLLPLLEQEQTLLADFGPDHPRVIAVRQQIALTRKFFEQAGRGSDQETTAAEQLRLGLQGLRRKLEEEGLSLRTYDKILKGEEQKAGELLKFREEGRNFREDITRTRELFEPIIKRLEEFKLVRDLGGFSSRALDPPAVGGKIGPVASRIILAAALLGLFGGLGLAYLAEITDKSFRTPEEIRRRIGLPILGHIPQLKADPATAESAPALAGLHPLLCTVFQPRSVQAESFRGLRTALFFSAQAGKQKILQITSPDSGDGKSSTVANLAISMAQAGKRVLLLDCDFRKPRIHKIFGLSRTDGFANVLAGRSDLPAAIQATAVDNLFVLPCGPRPDNPAELLTSPRFQEVLTQLREVYDWVLVDTPPLLAVSDPSIVASRVDGVVLVIRIVKNGRVRVERARDMLQTLGVKILGVVVNAVRARHGWGSRYGADPGYSYHYHYSYAYDDGRPDPERYYRHDSEGDEPDGKGTLPSTAHAGARLPNDEEGAGR